MRSAVRCRPPEGATVELEQMRQLDAIERLGTMSAAAEELHISQPALSRSIQRLEAELGCALFERAGRRVALNDCGRAAVEGARAILRDERVLRANVAAIAERARALHVSTVAPAPLWRLTALAMERFPRETLTYETVEEREALRQVVAGASDFAITCADPRRPGLTSCELMRDNLAVTLPPNHPLAARREVSFADLAGETFLIMTNIGFWRGVVDRGIPGATFIEQADRMVFSQLAHATPHCTFVTDAPFQRDAMSGRTVVPITDAGAHAVFYLTMRGDAGGLTAQLYRWVREHA